MLVGPEINPNDTEEVYIEVDNFNNLVGDLNTTASVLTIEDDVFANAESANGTEAIAELIKELEEIQSVSNFYKTHMSTGVVKLLENVRDNIVNTAHITGDALKNLDK